MHKTIPSWKVEQPKPHNILNEFSPEQNLNLQLFFVKHGTGTKCISPIAITNFVRDLERIQCAYFPPNRVYFIPKLVRNRFLGHLVKKQKELPLVLTSFGKP